MPEIKVYHLVLPNSSDELGEYDLGEVRHFDWIAYTYESGSYDGSGHAILKDGDKYYHHDLGHCSCYGPMEYFDEKADKHYGSLAELESHLGKGLLEDVKPVLDFIREKGL